jgi:NAD(P)-dependent dehydrogenase (short-subunit alcohol dehydrogenase family)
MNVMDLFSLKGKTALLTGGAGLYGRQITEALCEAGAEVWIASRNVEALKKVADSLGARAFYLDLASEESIDELIDTIIRESGRIDVLVNNAVTRCACSSWDQPMTIFDKSLRINVSSLFHITRRAVEAMKNNSSGSVINIGSYMGLVGGNPTNYEGTEMAGTPSPIYFFEKGGMANFTRWAASELGPFNIRVNCVHPGGLANNQPEAFVRNYCKNTPLGRLAGPNDLKGVIVFLASEASSYITGANIPVDGGYTAR